MLDAAVHRQLTALIDSATDKRKGGALDEDCLKAVKGICRQSDDNVLLAFELLMDRLKQPHAQV